MASVGHDGETVQTPGRLPPTIPSVSPATAAALPAGAHKADSTTRPAAVAKAELIVNADTPITGTYYLDPCLRHTLFHMPHAFSAATEAALTGMGAYATPQGTTSTAPTTSSTQTPISTASAPTVTPATNTLTAETSGPTPAPAAAAAGRHGESAHHHYAKVAQSWVVPPDARFVSESGPITLSLASIDEATHGVMETKTDADGKPTPVTPRGRTNVRVSVESKTGGVYIDVVSWILPLVGQQLTSDPSSATWTRTAKLSSQSTRKPTSSSSSRPPLWGLSASRPRTRRSGGRCCTRSSRP